jgi:hypothetical protein
MEALGFLLNYVKTPFLRPLERILARMRSYLTGMRCQAADFLSFELTKLPFTS